MQQWTDHLKKQDKRPAGTAGRDRVFWKDSGIDPYVEGWDPETERAAHPRRGTGKTEKRTGPADPKRRRGHRPVERTDRRVKRKSRVHGEQKKRLSGSDQRSDREAVPHLSKRGGAGA